MIIQKILVIGAVWPEPNSSAAGHRMLQLLSLFRKENAEITFATTAAESPFAVTAGMNCVAISLNCDSFDHFVRELNPDIVIFDRFMSEEQFGWRVVRQCPNALRILDSEDLHCLRRMRQESVKSNRAFEIGSLLLQDDAKREIASILRCDLTIVISEFEMELLKNLFKIDNALLHYLPIFAEPPEDIPRFEERQDFVFMGNFLHEPNADAVAYLKKTVWPLIRKKAPELSIRIYGAYPTEKTMQWHDPKENFHVHGRADDAAEAIKNARVMLAPLRFGAGIKGKLLEAMQCGTPSVTTTVGAEAINGNFPWNGFITDNPEAFADAAIELYENRSAWEQSQENGFQILNERFQRSDFESGFLDRISDLKSNLSKYRQENFIGAMLQFHTMRSTEFLSRWIAEKNKN